jgi:hypothetical protein
VVVAEAWVGMDVTCSSLAVDDILAYSLVMACDVRILELGPHIRPPLRAENGTSDLRLTPVLVGSSGDSQSGLVFAVGCSGHRAIL